MQQIEREAMEVDVVIVGAGPAGLSAAIRLKQLDAELSVVVLEKASGVGGHILSGAVLDPAGLDRLLPNWKERGAPVRTAVTEDSFLWLTPKKAMALPSFALPSFMHNAGNYIVSMANLCRWLASEAEALGVEIYPGMAASELVFGAQGELKGVVAGEFGKEADGTPGPNYEPGMELLGKYVFLSEGARGSLSKEIIQRYHLDRTSEPQKYGLGLKEIWQVAPEKHKEGRVMHTLGWPLGSNATGGGFAYHAENGEVHLGLIVDLNYKNPYLNPYMEFQRLKHHPLLAELLAGGKRIAYGARAIAKGGIQSLPQTAFPGGVLLGCSAGLVNLPRIKGNHNAMHSGIEAAEAAHVALQAGRSGDVLADYSRAIREGIIGQELTPVRNVAPLNGRFGLYGGTLLGGFDMWFQKLFKASLFGTLGHGKSDAEATELAVKHQPINYPKPDGVLSFDRLTNVAFSGTNHAEGQPSHLRLADPDLPIRINLPLYAEPAQRYCPAGVYEVVSDAEGPRFVVNAQNCVHCKTCDIKDPSQNITWITPQGGDGPSYPNM